jgi:flavin-dependent dehydrogenase
MGHLWIFTRSEHLSGGIGVLHPKPGELQSTLHKVMEDYQIPPNGLTLQVHVVPIYTGKEKISTSRTMLMSDAAGLVDPSIGWWRKRYTATRPPVSSFSSVIHTPSERSSTCTTKE